MWTLIFVALFSIEGGITLVKIPVHSREELRDLDELGLDITLVNRKAGFIEALFPTQRLGELSPYGYEIVELDIDSRIKGILRDFGPYYTWEEVKDFVLQLKSYYPELVRVDTIGYSWEGRGILAMRVTAGTGDVPCVLFTGVHHAREPIGASTILDIASRLLEGYGNDTLITWLMENREIWLVPVVNPDGYAYNEISNGFWRKNMRDNNEDGVFEEGYDGVDLNRNYGYMWGYDDIGSSPNPGSQVYRGPSPFSEPETEALRELADTIQPVIALNYHSYGNYLLFPWGYDSILTPEDTAFRTLSEIMTGMNGYLTGTGWELLYMVNGDSDDWLYGEQEEKPRTFSFTPEVGENFWQPDTNIILQQLEENWPMNLTAIEAAGFFIDLDNVLAQNSSGESPEPGDTIFLSVTIMNLCPQESGSDVQGFISTDEEGVELIDSSTLFGDLSVLPYGYKNNEQDPFILKLPEEFAKSTLTLLLHLEANSGGFERDIPIHLLVGEPTIALEEDFENGLGLWEVAGYGGPFQLTETSYHSPTHSVTESPSGSYGNNWDLTLTTTYAFDLSSSEIGSLTFWHRYALETGYDWGNVEITRDGNLWLTVAAFTGTQPDWEKVNIDLSPYLPAPYLKVRFHFTSDTYVRDDGWYIDDVLLTFDTVIVKVRERVEPEPQEKVRVFPTVIGEERIFSLWLDYDDSYDIQIFDASGRRAWKVFSGRLREGTHRFKIGRIPQGTYFISVQGRRASRIEKISLLNP